MSDLYVWWNNHVCGEIYWTFLIEIYNLVFLVYSNHHVYILTYLQKVEAYGDHKSFQIQF